MKKIMFITTSPTVGGNGDTVIEEAMDAAKVQGAEVARINIRDRQISPCKACLACTATGECCQKDDFPAILQALKDCDGVIAEAPIYFNNLAGQAVTLIDRFVCIFSPEYKSGKEKKLGIILTFGGSDPAAMEKIPFAMLGFFKQIMERRTVLFSNLQDKNSCRNSEKYLSEARELGEWIVE